MTAGPGGGRLFLAVALPTETRRALEAHLRAWLGERPLPGRAVVPGNWHFTLRFLGETAAEAAERLRRELRGAPLGRSFPVALGGLGAFPKPRRASVLWAGVEEGAGAMRALAEAVEAAAARAGFAAEPKPFRPHLTLSRLQPPRDVSALVEERPPLGARFAVREVVLLRSHLGGGPPRYEAVERFALIP